MLPSSLFLSAKCVCPGRCLELTLKMCIIITIYTGNMSQPSLIIIIFTILQIIFFSEQVICQFRSILARHKVGLVKQFYFYMHDCYMYVYCFIINFAVLQRLPALYLVSNVWHHKTCYSIVSPVSH